MSEQLISIDRCTVVQKRNPSTGKR